MTVNYGILQTPPTPGISTQVIQNPNNAAQNEQGLLSGLSSMNEAKRTAMEQKNTNSEITARNQQMQQSAQMFPGQLQTQQLQNQGLGLLNQTKQMEIASAKIQMQQRQDRVQAYQKAAAVGGSQAGLDAVENTYLNQGDVHSALKLKQVREKISQQIANDNIKGITQIGAQIHGVITDAKPPQVNPQTGQPIPGTARTPLDIYTARYKTISSQYPDAPKPSSFKNNTQFEDTFVHPVLENALPFQKEAAAKQNAMIKSNTYKAGLVVQDAKANLQNIISEKGANSQDAKDAATQLQQAQDDAVRVSQGGNYITGTLRAIKDVLPESLGGSSSINTTIKENTPGYKPETEQSVNLSQQSNQSQKTPNQLPSGVTQDMIRAELARRAQESK